MSNLKWLKILFDLTNQTEILIDTVIEANIVVESVSWWFITVNCFMRQNFEDSSIRLYLNPSIWRDVQRTEW